MTNSISSQSTGSFLNISATFTDDGTVTIPGGYRIDAIVVWEKSGAAMTTQQRVGTTVNGAEVRAAASVTANFLLSYAASSSFNCYATDTPLYVSYVKKTITNITQANPAVVTSASHGLSNGAKVTIASVVGMTEVNGIVYTIANVAANTFELSGIDSTLFTAYSSGGTAGGYGDASVTVNFQLAKFD